MASCDQSLEWKLGFIWSELGIAKICGGSLRYLDRFLEASGALQEVLWGIFRDLGVPFPFASRISESIYDLFIYHFTPGR